MSLFQDKPIIVIGMHRSGTSLIARLLSSYDIWMGWDIRDVNHESHFFQIINKKLLISQGEDWDSFPKTLAMLEEGPELLNLVNEVMQFLKVRIWVWHLGPKYAIRSLLLQNNLYWGWKDPRNTIFSPLWMHIFPNIRIVGVIRHPRDVCISLYYREYRRYDRKIKSGRSLKFIFPLSRNFDIWKFYTQRTLETVKQHPDCSILLRYEELKEKIVLQNLASFVGAHTNPADLVPMISYRENRYEAPPGLEQLEEIVASDPLAAELGYH